MRGEHLRERVWKIFGMESSPHARGARALSLAQRDEVGIIPACAGSTCSR